MSTLSILHVPKLDTTIKDDSSSQDSTVNLNDTSLVNYDLQLDSINSSVLSSPTFNFSVDDTSPSSSSSLSSPRLIPKQTRSVSCDLDLRYRNNSYSKEHLKLTSILTNPMVGSGGVVGSISSSTESSLPVFLKTGGAGTNGPNVDDQLNLNSNSHTRTGTNSGPPKPSFIKTNFDNNNYIYKEEDSSSSPLTSNSATSTTSTKNAKPHVRHRDSFQSAGPVFSAGHVFPSGPLSSAVNSNINNSQQHLQHIHTNSNSSKLSPVTTRRLRSKSFSEQVSETSQEAIRQLAPPISLPLVLTCVAWYGTSAMSNTLNKSILTAFPYPVTLSMVQFTLAACFGFSTLKLAQMSPEVAHGLPKGMVSPAHVGFKFPNKPILMATAPMGMFQLSGHILSHMSTSLIPVSLVHTIKALSPLFTVAAYRLLFGVSYKRSTYLSLIPLTLGVIMTCSVEFTSHFMGIIYALIAALIFVSQNMFSKRLLTSGNTGGDDSVKLDKLNILCYCSSLAFIFTFPLWFFSEGIGIFSDYNHSTGQFFASASTSTDGINTTTGLLIAFLTNGFVHFAQNLLAFQVLGMVSPVTYSVASLIKRIVVITVAILWFGQVVSATQGWGILLTFLGLYLYDRCGGDKTKNYESKTSVLPK